MSPEQPVENNSGADMHDNNDNLHNIILNFPNRKSKNTSEDAKNHMKFHDIHKDKTIKKDSYVTLPVLLTPGSRLKYIRKSYLKKSISELSNEMLKHPAALRRIENEEVSLKKDMASYYCICFLVHGGVYVDINWLMYGTGKDPYFMQEFTDKKTLSMNSMSMVPSFLKDCMGISNRYDHNILENDVILFKAIIGYIVCHIQKDTVSIMVNDNHMTPAYNKGDTVFGFCATKFRKNKLNGEDCIVKYPNNVTAIRRVFYLDSGWLLLTTHIGSQPSILPTSTSIYPVVMSFK